MLQKINYYFWATYQRKKLDILQEKYKHLYQGIVLDIGGRDRGKFIKPKKQVKKWIFADIEKKYNPDIILNVSNMNQIESNSIDVINAIELFEHVEKIEDGFKECYRILKNGGIMILAVPFLYPIHADPYDFQRWTQNKWQIEIKKLNFKIKKFKIMGGYFMVLCDYVKIFIKTIPKALRIICYIFYPFLDMLVKFDNNKYFKNNTKLPKFHAGYFIILEK